MKHPQLAAEKRTVLGKKVKQLRREGLLPANVYGKDLESVALQLPLKAFEAVFKEVGETGLVDLQVDGEKHPVLIKNLQLAYPLRIPLHVDFFQVNLKEKVKTMVPLVITGEAKAVTDNIGLILQTLSEVEVEALPEALPENIEVDVTHLAAIDDQITAENLKKQEGVEILTDPSQTIVKIAELVVEEPEEPTPAPDGEAAEGAEGEAAPAEGKAAEDVSEEPAKEEKSE